MFVTQGGIYTQTTNLLNGYPAILREYITLDEPGYDLLSRGDIEGRIFAYARHLTGTFRPPEDLQGALGDISRALEPQTTMAGINAPARLLIRAAPVTVVPMLYLIFLQLRRLRQFSRDAGEPWIFKDAFGWVGRSLVYAAAFVPGIVVLIITFCFLYVESYSIVIDGYILSVAHIFSIEPVKPLYEEGYYDFYVDTAYWPIFIISAYLSLRIARQLTELSRGYRLDS
jgi:hypothetical protein